MTLRHSHTAFDLRSRFATLTQSLRASSEVCEKWNSAFITRYTEPHRRYHTLAHVGAMLSCLDARRAEISDALAVEIAIYFHDWVYEPEKSTNEEESVVAFERFASNISTWYGRGCEG